MQNNESSQTCFLIQGGLAHITSVFFKYIKLSLSNKLYAHDYGQPHYTIFRYTPHNDCSKVSFVKLNNCHKRDTQVGHFMQLLIPQGQIT